MKIRCNSLHPGNARTAMWDGHATEVSRQRGVPLEAVVKEVEASIPMGEFTEPRDVASAVAFLTCDDARYVTGGKLVVDGGIIHCITFHMAVR